MFYYLLYNSSFTFIIDNRLFSTILYGSILYILTHAILNYCNIEILNIINNYFWILFVLDIISLLYEIYQVYINPQHQWQIDGNGNGNSNSNGNSNGNSNLNVSFNLLKNKINTLLDRKNDLTITHINTQNTQQQNTQQQNTQQQNTQQNTQQQNTQQQNTQQQNTQQNAQNQQTRIQNKTANKYSTPISQLKNKTQNLNTFGNANDVYDLSNLNDMNEMSDNKGNTLLANSGTGLGNTLLAKGGTDFGNTQNASTQNASTSINIIRKKQNNLDNLQPEAIINEDDYQESVAGSDIYSTMDLDDFEKSL